MENSTYEDEEEDESVGLHITIIVVSVCAIVVGITANCFIAISFCKVKHLRTVTNYFIFQLSIADIFLLLSLAIWIGFTRLRRSMNSEQQELTHIILISVLVFSSSASLTSLACVSIDRCLAVVLPLRYQSLTTHSRALCVVIIVWSYSILTFITSYARVVVSHQLYDHVFIVFLFALTFAIPVLVTTWSYYRIFCAVCRQVHHVPKQTTSNRRVRMIMKEFRVAVNLLVTILPTYILWGSFWIATLTEAFLENQPNYSMVVDWLLGNTPHFAAAVNPLIYIAMTRDFRILFIRLASCKNLRKDFSFVVESSRKLSVPTRTTLTTQNVPLVLPAGSHDFSEDIQAAEDSRSSNEVVSTESSFVTSSTPEENHDIGIIISSSDIN